MTYLSSSIKSVTKISGSIENITFHNEENGYCVLKIRVDDSKELAVVIANLPSINLGEHIDCEGEWITHPKFGSQFNTTRVTIKPPCQNDAIEKYLSSGIIKGIGSASAKKIVAAFGEKTLEAIEENFDLVKPIIGAGKKNWIRIKKGFEAYLTTYKKCEAERIWLIGLGVGPMSLKKLIDEYKENVIPVISQNPYILIEKVKGFGFQKSDQIALNLQIPLDSSFRIQAGFLHMLRESNMAGHCFNRSEELISSTEKLLGIDRTLLTELFCTLVQNKQVVCYKSDQATLVGLKKFDDYERAITLKIKTLNKHAVDNSLSTQVEKAIAEIEQCRNWTLNQEQRQAIQLSISHKLVIITGGPGTGKTTITQCIASVLSGLNHHRITGCSPTGRAAKRLSEALNVQSQNNKIECSSIHRLLEARVSKEGHSYFAKDQNNQLEVDTLIVDEVSMVDVSLFHYLLQALPNKARLILIGDVDQLPSVGPGSILNDLINSGTIPVVRLTEIQRQAQASNIIINAHRVNRGDCPDLEPHNFGADSDFYFIEEEEPQLIKERVLEVACHTIPTHFLKSNGSAYHPMIDIQVFSPMKNSITGVKSLNAALQQKLNPYGANRVQRGEFWFAQGDKVIQTKNNYDKKVFNGDIGFIEAISKKDNLIRVLFATHELNYADYTLNELDQLSLAYATTIHKAQGSEYPAVVIPLCKQHYMMLQRNLLYTGITRGKSLVFLIGQKEALKIAVKNNKTAQRITNLINRLRG